LDHLALEAEAAGAMVELLESWKSHVSITPSIRTSVKAIIQHDGLILVIRYHDDRGYWYTLPGGGQQQGETLIAALRREVAEETGLMVRVGSLRFVRDCLATPNSRALPPGFHQVELFFSCELESRDSRGASALDPGQVGFEWRRIEELRAVCFFPQSLLDAIEQGLKFGYLGAD
jgi:ADP-ribose pyrophosphatase YjhB (NUDIX family)